MKTSEFIRGVSDFGYMIEEYEWTIEVWDNHISKKYASIAKYSDKSLWIQSRDYSLVKLCMKYAETPVREREDVKKYRVQLPDPDRIDKNNITALKKVGYNVVIVPVVNSSVGNFDNYNLTEEEIKRNHSYLWQFAEEVKGWK